MKDISFTKRTVSYLLKKCHFIPDKLFLKLKYKVITGNRLDLTNPKSFNEKLQWLKLYDRKDVYTIMVDKYEAKKYVTKMIGNEYIIPTLGVYDKFEDIDFDKLPNRFVIKCTHDSGGLVVCNNKSMLNLNAVKRKINKCLKRNYYYNNREWPYKNVKPRIIVEKYMEDNQAKELIDYKVMCFSGKAKMIFTCTERFGDGLKVTFFDLDWNKLPFTRHYPASKKVIKKPKNFKKMIELSETLSHGITFVRMDWYEINGKLYFGEYTFFPGNGMEEFEPEKWDEKIGEWIDLSSAKSDDRSKINEKNAK